tara:strand:- start:423 stop:611 length:189 start_codon:yes stop_codon:yes gene_type:complete
MIGRQEILPELDYSQYSGEWVVISDNKVVAHNKDLTKINKDINKCKKAPTVTKIPAEGQLIF